MDLPITVPLKRPIIIGDQTTNELVFDEPDIDTQIAYMELSAGFPDEPTQIHAMQASLFWIARLSGVSTEIAGKVKETDMPAVQEAVQAILDVDGDDGGDGSGNEDPAK